MKVKRSMLIIACGLFSAALFSQVEESIPQKGNQKNKENGELSRRIVLGSEFGLSFGTITYIKLAPLIGYKITPRFSSGIGPIYIYEKYRDYHLETSTYGGRIAASFTVLRATDLPRALSLGDISLHVENEVINVAIYDPYYFQFTDRVWIDNVLIGAGVTQDLSERFGVSIFILWDVTQNFYSPYSNPVLKFSFSFYL